MLRISVESKRKPDDVIKRAVDFFGPDGYGLKVTEQSDTCASFEGGGGGIEITTCTADKGSSVEFTSREWDSQVKDFIGKIT